MSVASQAQPCTPQLAIVFGAESEFLDLRLSPDRQIWPFAGRAQKCLGAAPTPTRTLIDIEIPDTGVVAGVEILNFFNSGLLSGIGKTVEHIPASGVVFQRAIHRQTRACLKTGCCFQFWDRRLDRVGNDSHGL